MKEANGVRGPAKDNKNNKLFSFLCAGLVSLWRNGLWAGTANQARQHKEKGSEMKEEKSINGAGLNSTNPFQLHLIDFFSSPPGNPINKWKIFSLLMDEGRQRKQGGNQFSSINQISFDWMRENCGRSSWRHQQIKLMKLIFFVGLACRFRHTAGQPIQFLNQFSWRWKRIDGNWLVTAPLSLLNN